MTEALPKRTRPISSPRVSVVEGVDKGLSLRIADKVFVGSAEHNDLKLSDPTVSRRHASFMSSAAGVIIEDEGSRNGTWLNDVRIERACLPVGARVRLGSTVVEVGTESHPREAQEPVPSSFGRFVGRDPALRPFYRTVRKAAQSEATVLIEGESGTGKELVAEAIHDNSDRSDGPMVVIDCSAIAENLIESELFGHVAGAFTGASGSRMGAFEKASGGTVFLDEIGELPLPMQTRLLRVLEQREIRRVGSSTPVSIDVRVVAATNRRLDREVEESRFRLDLFHRLAVLVVRIPPLRERRSDLLVLAEHFTKQFGADPSALTSVIRTHIESYTWPGNARELRNYVERVTLLGEHALRAEPELETLESIAAAGLPYRKARAKALELFTRMYTDITLERHGGNVTKAAEASGVARRHFQRLKK